MGAYSRLNGQVQKAIKEGGKCKGLTLSPQTLFSRHWLVQSGFRPAGPQSALGDRVTAPSYQTKRTHYARIKEGASRKHWVLEF